MKTGFYGSQEEFRLADGRLHREDGPAKIVRSRSGALESEEWFLNGESHRVNGPAYIAYRGDNGDGGRMTEMYFVHGKLSRLDGPARIDYDHSGEDVEWRHYFAGREVEAPFVIGMTAEEIRVAEHKAVMDVALLSSLADLQGGIEASGIYAELVADGRDPDQVALQIAEGMRDGVFTAEGLRAMLDGAPVEWARAFEAGSS